MQAICCLLFLSVSPCLGGNLDVFAPETARADEATSASLASSNQGMSMFVEVKETLLRREPKHWSPGIANLKYGDEVVVNRVEGDWYFVSAKTAGSSPGGLGYVHRTALTARLVVLKGNTGQAATKASDREIVLAGKGFSADVEALFAKKAPQISFAIVDAVETRKVPARELEAFVEQGGLS